MLLERSYRLLEGACDMHIHGGPDTVERRQDIIDISEEARMHGMAGLVFKDHNSSTADRATIASRCVKDIHIYGGIVLNHAVGGFNIHAVEMAIRMGAKVVWMPSVDACCTVHNVKVANKTPWLELAVNLKNPKEGLTVLNEQGEVLPTVKEILALIYEKKVILDTCHLGAEESYKLVREAGKMGIKKIVVTHPNCSVNKMSIEEQKQFAEAGAYLTYAFLPCMPGFDGQRPAEIAAMISRVGPRHCIMVSDFGQVQNPTVVEGMRMFITHMLMAGLSFDQISMMVKDNPQKMLDISSA